MRALLIGATCRNYYLEIPTISHHTQMEKSVRFRIQCWQRWSSVMGSVCFLFLLRLLSLCKSGILRFLPSALIPEGANHTDRAATVISIQVSFKFIFNRWVLKSSHSVTDKCPVCLSCWGLNIIAHLVALQSLSLSLSRFLFSAFT